MLKSALTVAAVFLVSTPSFGGESVAGGVAAGRVPEWLTAIGTVAAVVVALFLAVFHEHLRRWWWHPTLEIRLRNSPPDSHRTIWTHQARNLALPCYYFRIRVHNSGNASAENVEVFIERIERRRADGEYENWQQFLPLNLLWSHYGFVYFPKIAPDTEKYCDLGHIFRPDQRQQLEREGEDNRLLGLSETETVMCLDLAVRPNTGSHLLPRAEYRIGVVAVAANAAVERRTLELNLTGQWFDDEPRMLREGIGLNLAPKG